MDAVTFFVPGIPKPQGSKVYGVTKAGKPYGREANPDLRNWRAVVGRIAGLQPCKAWPEEAELLCVFLFNRPKSHFDARGNLRSNAPSRPAVKPDVSKLVRAVEDALTGVLLRDDAQIVTVVAEKAYTRGRPGVAICIGETALRLFNHDMLSKHQLHRDWRAGGDVTDQAEDEAVCT